MHNVYSIYIPILPIFRFQFITNLKKRNTLLAHRIARPLLEEIRLSRIRLIMLIIRITALAKNTSIEVLTPLFKPAALFIIMTPLSVYSSILSQIKYDVK